MSYIYNRTREYGAGVHTDPDTYNIGHPGEPMTMMQRIETDLGKTCIFVMCGTKISFTFEEELIQEEIDVMDAAIAAQKAVADWPYVPPEDPPIPTEQHGFVDRSGYDVYIKGFHYEIAEDTDLEMNIAYEDFLKLEGLNFRADENAAWKDYVNIELVHPVYGVLKTFGETVYMSPNRVFECVCPDAKDFPAGIIFRVTYVSDPERTGSVNFNFEPRTRTTPET